MCLSTVRREQAPANEELAKNVARLEIAPDGTIRVYDILGRCTVLSGELLKIDFMDNVVVMR